jgi:hypothetical protein
MHRRKLALTFLALSGVAVMLALAFGNRSAWSVDFNQYYAAGSLAGTGHLYDWPAIQARELEHGARAVPFGRLPAFALAMKPFSALPYSIARGLFLALELAALAASCGCGRFHGERGRSRPSAGRLPLPCASGSARIRCCFYSSWPPDYGCF